jgi:signal transduction histidine kinase
MCLTTSWLHCKLLLRSTNDLEVLELPSWWTTRHVIYLATVFGLLILVLLCLVMYNQIARWKLQVVLRERERMARDVHDSMAQSFAGIGFQLQAIVKAIPQGMPALAQEVALARELIRLSHKGARQSFAPIEPEADQEIDLLRSLESSAHKMVVGGAITITVSSAGSSRTIPPMSAGSCYESDKKPSQMRFVTQTLDISRYSSSMLRISFGLKCKMMESASSRVVTC